MMLLCKNKSPPAGDTVSAMPLTAEANIEKIEGPVMKHHRILYRALCALLCLGLCAQLTACGKKPVPKPGSSGPSAPSTSAKVYDDSLITEVYDEEDSFTDEYGTEYSYICHVPQLEADTLDAAESGETPNSQYM